MPDRLRIQRIGHPDAEVELQPGTVQVGRNQACQVVIDHPEVGDQVATVECRGGNYFAQNLCPYAIFIGQQSVAPRAWSPWLPGETLRLSKSVSLDLVAVAETPGKKVKSAASAADDATSTPDGEGRRKLIQLVVTIGCLALGGLLLMSNDSDRQVGGAKPVTFEELLEQLKQSQPRDKNLSNLLQEAWTIDLRVRRRGNRADAIKAYDTLLAYPEVRDAKSDRNSLYGSIKVFANERRLALSNSGPR
jgi:hypothetical protein